MGREDSGGSGLKIAKAEGTYVHTETVELPSGRVPRIAYLPTPMSGAKS